MSDAGGNEKSRGRALKMEEAEDISVPRELELWSGLTIMVNDRILSRFKDDPPTDWSEGERLIGTGPLYPPDEIIALLRDSDAIRPQTARCRNDIQALELDNEDLARLIKNAVSAGRYRKSAWCRLSANAIAACDDYVVIDKTWVEAAHKEMDCEMYLKFAINSNGKLLLMVSCHPST